jgi:uncharacterized protein
MVDSGSSPDARFAKAAAIAQRVGVLVRTGRRLAADVAVSHNSYAQVVAARLLRIPAVTAMDYEHQPANHVAFRLAQRVVVPEVFPADALGRFGARPSRVRRYSGVKEELYVSAADVERGERERLGLPAGERLVLLRLPPDGALYHRHANGLVGAVVERAAACGATVAILGRTEEQRAAWRGRGRRIVVLQPPVDTLSLLLESDAFVGAGGTMTREAAVLGVPTWSIFLGRPAAVDAWLAERGRLTVVTTVADAARVRFVDATRKEPLDTDRPDGPMATLLRAIAEVAR